MFTERDPNEVVFHTSEGIIRHTVSDGDSVTLHSGDQRVLVRNVTVLSPGRYSGIICGFEPSFATEHNGLEINQKVSFLERNIFGFHSA